MAAPRPDSSTLVDLFGLLACMRLFAFEQRGADAARAGSYEDEVVLGRLAVDAFEKFERLRDHLIELGADPQEAVAPFRAAVADYHERTRPSDSLEALVKVYIADAVNADIVLAAVGGMDAATGDLVRECLADSGHTDLVTERLRAAAGADPGLASRLSLWARRLVGETLSHGHAAITERAALAPLTGGEGVLALFERVTDAHNARMRTINLSA